MLLTCLCQICATLESKRKLRTSIFCMYVHACVCMYAQSTCLPGPHADMHGCVTVHSTWYACTQTHKHTGKNSPSTHAHTLIICTVQYSHIHEANRLPYLIGYECIHSHITDTHIHMHTYSARTLLDCSSVYVPAHTY